MKLSVWSTIIVVAAAVGLTALVAFFAVRATPASAVERVQPAASAVAGDSASGRAAELQAAFAQREAAYQAQIQQVSTLLQERQTLYSQQLTELGSRAAAGEALLQQIASQEQILRGQIAELESARTQRQAHYQEQLSAAQTQYAARAATINAQLAEAQARLAEANALLGR